MIDVKHIFFGDSLTACETLPPEDRWINKISTAVAEEFSEIINYSAEYKAVCGENTRQALERMQFDVQIPRPKILTIQFGANDSDYWLSNNGVPCVSLDAFRANLNEMIVRAKAFGTEDIVLHTNHIFLADRKEINNKTHAENQRPYNQVIREICHAQRTYLVDIENDLRQYAPKEYCLPQPDAIHQSSFGSELYFKSAYLVVKEIIDRILNA